MSDSLISRNNTQCIYGGRKIILIMLVDAPDRLLTFKTLNIIIIIQIIFQSLLFSF